MIIIPDLKYIVWQVHTLNQCLSVRPSVCRAREVVGNRGKFYFYSRVRLPGISKAFVFFGNLCSRCREHSLTLSLSRVQAQPYLYVACLLLLPMLS